jgi:hypothetical protein
MAYLTLRGIALARAIGVCFPRTSVVEVHPGAAMALRGAPVKDVRSFRKERASRRRLASWLAGQGVHGLPLEPGTDHELAACACALAAWRWNLRRPAWLAEASGPLHPFPFAC